MRILFCLLTVCFFSNTLRAHGGSSLATPHSAVIFLPGYLGSFLRDVKTKERVYVGVSSVLERPGALSLYQAELQTPAGPELEIDGVMDYVPALFWKVDVYGSMLAQLNTLPDTRVVPFDYDWRKDPFEAVQRLDALITSLKAQGISQIDLVAHSAGGWLVSYYLAYGAQAPAMAQPNWSGARNIRRVVLLGVPYQGGFPLFREMSRGSSLPMMGSLLPADALASFPSVYCTTPLGAGHFLDKDGKPLDLSLANLRTWTENNLGLMARTELPDAIRAARSKFLGESLAACGHFLDLLQLKGASEAPASLSLLSVVGTGTKTMDKGFLVEEDGAPKVIFDVDKPSEQGLDESLIYADGDGMVPVASTVLPAAFAPRAQRLISGATHEKLPTDEKIQKSVIDFLR